MEEGRKYATLIPYSHPGTSVRALDENKLIWIALDVAGSPLVVKTLINAPLLGEWIVGYDLDTVKYPHIFRGSVNRWDVYVNV